MSIRLKILGFILLPFLFMVGINECSPSPTHAYDNVDCSRYCHDKGCPHASSFREDHPQLSSYYVANIQWLKNNPLGMSYQAINLLIYVILAPLFMLLLFWGLIRKRHG